MNPLARRLGLTALLLAALFGVGRLLDSPAPPPQEDLSLAPLLDPVVTVRLMSLSGRETIPLEISGHWVLRDGDHPQTPVLHQASGFRGDMRSDPTGPQVGAYRSNRDHIVLEAFGHEALRIGSYLYPGKLHIRVERESSGLARGLQLSLELSLEDYVTGVVCGEMPSQAQGAQQALCAQAIAARTYALQKRGRGRPLRDDTFDQVFRGLDFHTWQAQQAVDATRGLVLRWEDALVPAYFHRDCGGGTADAFASGFHDAAMRPLQGTLEPACRTPRDIWEHHVSAEQLDALARRYHLGSWLQGISTIQRDASGRMLRVRLLGEDDHEDLSAEQMRAALHLPSTQLVEVLVQQDGSAVFRGHGFGHGVGMCQQGSLRMSRSGASFQEILQHYYPGAELVPLTSDLEHLLPPLSR